ncbi:MAG TPA: Uma2 family endonuclease [Isosphaeraceae bacterium]|nr:Uma2 family endonuclease [Isosphaeraceae bacterium]
MTPIARKRAMLADLARTDGKAELIGGRIVPLMASGHRPSRVAFRITRGLDDYAEATGRGIAYADGMGFAVPELPSGRESFSPDSAFYVGPLSESPMRFIEGPPTLVVAVRSEDDYGEAAEAEQAAKRADYFTAGTLVVWDVDPVADCVHVSRAAEPDRPTTYTRGQTAEAAPGWRALVDGLFG